SRTATNTPHRYPAERAPRHPFSTAAAVVIALLALLVFWEGVKFLRNDVFKNYFNPARHTIVEQDSDTLEVFSWKDSSGHVYTASDPDVTRFPYGIMFLILAVLGLAVKSHNLVTARYTAALQAGESQVKTRPESRRGLAKEAYQQATMK
ncbi:MAG: hypothetical protein ACUVSK_03490, partial [Desulfotomaculales bacterium]